MAWERLDEIYGSPEAVEQALFSKLENFPKVTTKDPQRLRDLADLLLELQAAKEDGYLASLSYLDTSRGVSHLQRAYYQETSIQHAREGALLIDRYKIQTKIQTQTFR